MKKLFNKIPENMIVVKTKNRIKFYSLNLEKLNTIILEQSMEALKEDN